PSMRTRPRRRACVQARWPPDRRCRASPGGLRSAATRSTLAPPAVPDELRRRSARTEAARATTRRAYLSEDGCGETNRIRQNVTVTTRREADGGGRCERRAPSLSRPPTAQPCASPRDRGESDRIQTCFRAQLRRSPGSP